MRDYGGVIRECTYAIRHLADATLLSTGEELGDDRSISELGQLRAAQSRLSSALGAVITRREQLEMEIKVAVATNREPRT